MREVISLARLALRAGSFSVPRLRMSPSRFAVTRNVFQLRPRPHTAAHENLFESDLPLCQDRLSSRDRDQVLSSKSGAGQMRRFTSWEPLEVRRLMAADDLIPHPGTWVSNAVAAQVADSRDAAPSAQPVGSLTGYKFLDSDADRLRDVEATADSHFVFVLDASGSSGQPFENGDFTRLQAEAIAIGEFQQELVRRGLGSAKLTVIVFGSEATTLDLDPVTSGVQMVVEAAADRNLNRIPDVTEALAAVRSQGATSLESALAATIAALEGFQTPPAKQHVVLLSDGISSRGGEVEALVPRVRDLAATIRAIALGDVDLAELRQLDPQAAAYANLRALRTATSSLQSVAGIRFAEPGLANVTIYLDQNFNCMIDPGELVTTTQDDDPQTPDVDETGRYVFEQLIEGTYVIREEMRPNIQQTWPVAGAHTVKVAAAGIQQDGMGYDFGNRPYPGGIRGVVFRDANANGRQDPTESGIAGVVVYLDQDGNATLDTTEPSMTTAQLGHYAFHNLPSGVYVVRIVVPALAGPIMPLAAAGLTRTVVDKLVEADFGLIPAVPPPTAVIVDPRVDRIPVIRPIAEPQAVKTITLANLPQTEAPPFLGGGGGEVLPATASVSQRSTAVRQVWLQAIEMEVGELLPDLAEVLSVGVFEPDPGDPPPARRRIKGATVSQVVLKPAAAPSDPSDQADFDGWSGWWWSLAPISAMAGGLWWRYGPPRRSKSATGYFARRTSQRFK